MRESKTWLNYRNILGIREPKFLLNVRVIVTLSTQQLNGFVSVGPYRNAITLTLLPPTWQGVDVILGYMCGGRLDTTTARVESI